MPIYRLFALGVAVVVMLPFQTSEQERSQARSMVISQRGIVATSQTLASQAGAMVLARGGNAVDAAIAANAVMNVVEPMSNGMGGDLFVLYRDAKTGTLSGLNSSGWSPQTMTLDALKHKGFEKMPQSGIWSVTVPGCVAGWEKLHQKFGKLPWADLFQPAIYFAEHGFPVTEIIQGAWTENETKLRGDDYASRVFLPNGRPPRVGEVFRNPDLAKALRLVASEGSKAFYRGPIGAAILAKEKKLDGPMAAADLEQYEPEWVEPLETVYRGWKVYELPPNGQGFAALEMLNLMEQFPWANSARCRRSPITLR